MTKETRAHYANVCETYARQFIAAGFPEDTALSMASDLTIAKARREGNL